MRLSHVLLCAVIGAATFGGTAYGQDEAENRAAKIEQVTNEAVKLYDAHDYRKAIEKFLEAYALDPDPNLIFNVARCYEALGDSPAAQEKYEEFLSKPGGDMAGRRRAEEALERLRNPQKAGPTGGPGPGPGGTTTSGSFGATGPGTEQPAMSSLQIAGLGIGGVGIVGLAVGTIFGLSAKSKNDDAGKTCDPNNYCTDTAAPGLTDDARSMATVSTVSFLAGGTLLVGGALLYFLAPPEKTSTAIRISPQVAPQNAGLSLTGVW